MSKYLPLDLFIRQALLYPLDSPFLPPENKVEKDHSYAAGRKTGSLVAAAPLHTGQTTKYADYDDADHDGTAKDFTAETIEGDKVVKDNHTGLMWQDGHSDKVNWADALAYAHNSAWGGFDDWRVPTVAEMITLLDYEQANITNAAFTVSFWTYWTGTTVKASTTLAFVLGSTLGDIYYTAKTTAGANKTKLVRNF